MRNRKKYSIVLAGMMLIGAISAGTTLSYFTESEMKTNVFTMGDLDIGLEEPEWDPDPKGDQTPDGKNMYPGYTVYKNPTVKNLTSDKNGAAPCYVRMKVNILDSSGNPVKNKAAIELIRKTIYFDSSYNGTYSGKGTSEGLIENRIPGYSLKDLAAYPSVNPHFAFDEARSTLSVLVYNYKGADGNGILNIGDEATLFTNIVIPTDWNQTQFRTIGDFQLKVEAECIQSSGFADQESAYKALDREIAQGTLQKSGQ